MRLFAGGKSYIGNTREVNQDAVVVRSTERKGNYFILMAVCDGIGGLEHGEYASVLAANRINEWYDSVMSWLRPDTADMELMISHLKDLAEECNQLIWEYKVVKQLDTGTTMSLLMIIREHYYIIQVGDSRVYRYREKRLEQLTVDASVSRMKNGKMKQYLDNYLGKNDTLWFTSTKGEIQKEDIYLICSDGLYHYLQPEDMEKITKEVRKARKIEGACGHLIDKMLERGERDNITVGMVSVNG